MLYIEQHLKDQLADHLTKNERLIWAGTPKKGFIFRPVDFFMIPFSLVWCAFVAFWVYMALQASVLFAFFGIPFALVGVYLLIGRFISDKSTREKTVYGLTNERVIIKVAKKKLILNSFNLASINGIELQEDADGSGTIIIGDLRDRYDFSTKSKDLSNASPSSSRLYKISDARKVHSEILQVQKELIASSTEK